MCEINRFFAPITLPGQSFAAVMKLESLRKAIQARVASKTTKVCAFLCYFCFFISKKRYMRLNNLTQTKKTKDTISRNNFQLTGCLCH